MIDYFYEKNLIRSLKALLTSAEFSYSIMSRRTQTKSEIAIR